MKKFSMPCSGTWCCLLTFFVCDYVAASLNVNKPKSTRRGKGRVQHLKIERPEVMHFLEAIFVTWILFSFFFHSPLVCLGCAGIYGWFFLEACKPSPASIGGGGENQAYPKGESIQSILWRMRFVPQVTLDSYLPELAAESLFFAARWFV